MRSAYRLRPCGIHPLRDCGGTPAPYAYRGPLGFAPLSLPRGIVGAVKKVGDIVAEIAAASAEQSAGIDQVNQAVTSMDEVTQQNAALAEQTSAASASMQEKAQEMVGRMRFFTVSG